MTTTATTTPKSKRVVKPRKAKPELEPGVSEIEIERPVDSAPEVPKVYKTFEDYNYRDLQVYAGIDTYVTSKLLKKLHPLTAPVKRMKDVTNKIEKVVNMKPAFDLVHDIYMPIQDFILDLEFNGLKYDVEGNRKMLIRADEDIAEMRDKIFTEVGYEFDLNSEKVLVETLYGKMGLPVINYSKGGGPSTDGETFRQLYKSVGYDWLKTLGRYKEVNATTNTFIRSYVSDFVRADGRLHPSFNVVGTSSARLTGEKPNLTQLPNERNGYNLRELYIVEPGNVLVMSDFSSAEVKLLGAMSKDPMLLRAIELGYDFHSFSASLMQDVDYEMFAGIVADESHPEHKHYKEMRRRAKALTFKVIRRLQSGMAVEERT